MTSRAFGTSLAASTAHCTVLVIAVYYLCPSAHSGQDREKPDVADEDCFVEWQAPKSSTPRWLVTRSGNHLTTSQEEGVRASIEVLATLESQFEITYPNKSCGSALLKDFLKQDRICAEATYNDSSRVGATAFPGPYDREMTLPDGSVVLVIGRGQESIHVMPDYLPTGGETFSYRQQVHLALMLMHESLHLRDRTTRRNAIEYERFAYSTCMSILARLLAHSEVTGTLRSAICDYLVTCVEQLRHETLLHDGHNILRFAKLLAESQYDDVKHGDGPKRLTSAEFLYEVIQESAKECGRPISGADARRLKKLLDRGGKNMSLAEAGAPPMLGLHEVMTDLELGVPVDLADVRQGDIVLYVDAGDTKPVVHCGIINSCFRNSDVTLFGCHASTPDDRTNGGIGVGPRLRLDTTGVTAVLVRWIAQPR